MLKKQGFTLMELLIVVVIIGTLVAIAVPSYREAQERAKSAQAQGTLRSMRSAGLEYFAQNQVFTGATTANLGTLVDANFSTTADWTFSLAVAANACTFQAARRRGQHRTKVITVNQDDAWSDPDGSATLYPWGNL